MRFSIRGRHSNPDFLICPEGRIDVKGFKRISETEGLFIEADF